MIHQTLTCLALLMGGLLLGSCATFAQGTISDATVVRWVDKTVTERQPAAEDKRFDEIAWASDIRAAIKLGREHNRPIVLFTGDGRINTGRC
jgi:hypothetical protein